jgi:hypothetical protein
LRRVQLDEFHRRPVYASGIRHGRPRIVTVLVANITGSAISNRAVSVNGEIEKGWRICPATVLPGHRQLCLTRSGRRRTGGACHQHHGYRRNAEVNIRVCVLKLPVSAIGQAAGRFRDPPPH